MRRARERAVLATLVAAFGLGAQEPGPAPVDPGQKQAQELVDRFHSVMPKAPEALRQEAVRRERAPKALPLLREIRAFAAANPKSPFAGRTLEFTLYALVFGDEALTTSLREQSQAGDASARLLLDCSAVIVAADGKQRAAAIDAVAASLRERERPAPADAALCASYCLSIAGELSEAEAKTLASSTVDAAASKRFTAVAEAAAKDARRLLGQPFELAGRTLAGTKFTTTSLRGKVVLVDFWATWCGPCVRALPSIVEARRKFGARGLEVVGVSSDREESALTRFLAEHAEVDWPQLFEPGTKGFHPLAQGLGITAIPRLFLIDKKGVLRSVDAHEQLEELIERLLAE
jgi:thiol-disulfide isomerase/thioredoxin